MLRETKSTCCYCGVGCGVIIEHNDEEITGVRGDPEHPANFGKLCSKGSSLHLSAQTTIQQQVRALYPEMRTERGVERQRVSWQNCIDTIATRMHQCIQEHGPNSVAFYVSGQMLTEDYYVFNKLAKGLVGTNNIDSNSRLCMSSAVAGYKQSLGADAPPCSYEDIDHADCIFISGSNTAYAHPILYRRIEAARANNPAMKLIVVDPRRTETAQDADLHLAIQPGTDVALMHGLLHICLWEGWLDQQFIREHTEGFDALKTVVRDYTPAMVAKTCGIREQDLVQAAQWFAQAKSSLSLYCQGLNQSSSGTAKNSALINLHLATGQIGRVGAGPFSLTGQPNAMGGREVGGMANLLSGHRDLSNPQDRAEIAQLWQVDDVPAQAGKTAVDLFDAVRSGDIKIVWIVCTNPAQSMPDQNKIREALQKAELVIVQEAYRTTATCDYADILLPASSWGEKSGTVTNSERRISRVRTAISAPGEARADWQIACDVAQVLATRLRRQHPYFGYTSPEEVWNEHRASTAQRDLDITGLSYDILETKGSQQWPFPLGARQGATRLYTDHQFATTNGKAKFIATPYQAAAEKPNARFPFVLTTGRLRDQWHGMSRTGTVASLFAHEPEPCAYFSAIDLQSRMIKEGDFVKLRSPRGSMVLTARASEQVAAGQIFVPMHWGEETVSGHLDGADGDSVFFGINALCNSAKDPISHQPELKYAQVRVEKCELAWHYLVIGWIPREKLYTVQQALRAYFKDFSYAHCILFGHEQVGLVFRAAHTTAVPTARLLEIEALMGIDSANSVRYDDKPRQIHKHFQTAKQENQLVLRAFALAGDIQATAYLRPLLESQTPLLNSAELLRAKHPETSRQQNKVICSCAHVSQSQIIKQAEDFYQQTGEATTGESSKLAKQCLQGVQDQLGCGTHCGSCLPEVRRIISRLPVLA